jgi:hypothetical protein
MKQLAVIARYDFVYAVAKQEAAVKHGYFGIG